MNLPDTNLLNFFNVILISLLELKSDGNECSVDTLLTHCKSVAFGGKINVYEDVLEYCKYCGLVQIKNEEVKISFLGQKFLDSNREKFFEITDSQKNLIAERIIFKGAWNNHARELFGFFYPNFKNATYELSISDTILPQQCNATVHLLKFLGIIEEVELLLQVNKKYSELVYQLTADSKALSELQLEKILMENRKLGARAENVIVEFEKKRLRKLGKIVQAELVSRISVVNTAAGYDIESFDGQGNDFIPNRFIEVKATQGDELRFYWSRNEKEIASKKKETYWIYLLKGFNESDSLDVNPIMIQNPEQKIPVLSYLEMEAHNFVIREIAELELSEYSLEEMLWYQLG